MKNMKRVAKTVGTLGLVGCAVMNSPFAVAADSGWVGGVNIGQSRAKIDDAQITAGLRGSGLATTSMVDDNRDTGYKIFAGYKFNKNFSLEGGYFNLGQFGYTATTNPAGTLTGKIKLQGLNLDAVGILPITEKLSAFGRFGLQYSQARDNFAGTGNVVVANSSTSKWWANWPTYKAGLGVQMNFNQSVGLRGEWERYRINDAVGSRGDIDMFSVGLVFMFGGNKPAHAPPRKVAAAPAMVIVPIPVKTDQYCSILDFEFEINQDDIQREEKEKLAVLGTFMTKYPKTTAVIEGHSDDVGTAEDNMKLSQHRAESVVSYLVDGLHIAPSRLTAVGYGETRPIADNDTDEGKRMNRRIDAVVACATDIEGLKVVPARLTMALEMEFDQNKADIKPQYGDELRRVANYLNANPSVTATVEGHTANLATPELAMVLSERRAQNVVNYLVDNLGVSRSQLSTAAFGETRRFAYNTSLEGQQENRRINIIINYTK